MNKINEQFDELDLKVDRLRQKIKTSKVICKNNTDGNSEIVFAHNVYGANKVLSYEIIVLGKNPTNIVVKLDDVVINSTLGLVGSGEILLKSQKLYSLAVICSGEEMLAAKLRLEAADLRII